MAPLSPPSPAMAALPVPQEAVSRIMSFSCPVTFCESERARWRAGGRRGLRDDQWLVERSCEGGRGDGRDVQCVHLDGALAYVLRRRVPAGGLGHAAVEGDDAGLPVVQAQPEALPGLLGVCGVVRERSVVDQLDESRVARAHEAVGEAAGARCGSMLFRFLKVLALSRSPCLGQVAGPVHRDHAVVDEHRGGDDLHAWSRARLLALHRRVEAGRRGCSRRRGGARGLASRRPPTTPLNCLTAFSAAAWTPALSVVCSLPGLPLASVSSVVSGSCSSAGRSRSRPRCAACPVAVLLAQGVQDRTERRVLLLVSTLPSRSTASIGGPRRTRRSSAMPPRSAADGHGGLPVDQRLPGGLAAHDGQLGALYARGLVFPS